MTRSEQDREVMRALCLQARVDDPSLTNLTPARRRILKHLDLNGDVRFWPPEVFKSPMSLKPYRALQLVGFVEEVYDAERFVVSRITEDGRAALDAAPAKHKRAA